MWRYGRDRIVVSTSRCGRDNPGSNPGHGRDAVDLWRGIATLIFTPTNLLYSPETTELPQSPINSFNASCCSKGSAPYWSNPLIFWHSGAQLVSPEGQSALIPERQSARMSKIKNGVLDQYSGVAKGGSRGSCP